MLAYVRLMSSNFYELFRHETWDSEDSFKIAKILEQKQCRMDIAQEILTTFNDNQDLFKKAITGDQSWVYGYDIETKAQ